MASALQSCNIKDNSDGSETDRDIHQPWPSYPTTYSNPPNLVPIYNPPSSNNNLGPIYNPAPPPSTYMTFGGPGLGPINNQSPSGSSGAGGGSSLRHTLAASGSGSESDGGGGNIANLSI